MAKNDKNIFETKDNDTPIITEDQYEMARTVAAGCTTDSEFKLFIYIANKYKLDPLLKEIWCIKRNQKEPAIIMTSRDGFLSIAHRSGAFDGLQSGTIENEKGELVKAWCEVWRKDMAHSFKSEVKFSEYKQGNFIWQKYPSAMLIKVAEVFALKRAFSISGMLTQEELGYDVVQKIPERQEEAVEGRGNPYTDDGNIDYLKGQIIKLGKELGLDEETTKDTVERKFKIADFDTLNEEQAEETVEALEKKLSKK
jgi:phage recombination protein Bet